MKRTVIATMSILLAAGISYFAFAAEQEKAKTEKPATNGQQVTITGNLSCTFCKLRTRI